MDQDEMEDPALKVRGKGNLEVGKAEVLMVSGARPTCEEYVQATEKLQLQMFE